MLGVFEKVNASLGKSIASLKAWIKDICAKLKAKFTKSEQAVAATEAKVKAEIKQAEQQVDNLAVSARDLLETLKTTLPTHPQPKVITQQPSVVPAPTLVPAPTEVGVANAVTVGVVTAAAMTLSDTAVVTPESPSFNAAGNVTPDPVETTKASVPVSDDRIRSVDSSFPKLYRADGSVDVLAPADRGSCVPPVEATKSTTSVVDLGSYDSGSSSSDTSSSSSCE